MGFLTFYDLPGSLETSKNLRLWSPLGRVPGTAGDPSGVAPLTCRDAGKCLDPLEGEEKRQRMVGICAALLKNGLRVMIFECI